MTSKMTDPETKRERLSALSTGQGAIAAVAIDQRKSLRRLIADRSSRSLDTISDSALAEFKTAVVRTLSREASAVLLDTEYGLDAAKARQPNCGLLLAYESDGYENPRPHRMLALDPRLSVRKLRDLGASGIKILLHYFPHDDERANEEKCNLIERIGNECAALEMPFFLEPVIYIPEAAETQPAQDGSAASLEAIRKKPELVVEMMREFSRSIYKIDILKVEFPVVPAYVEGSKVFGGRAAYSMEEALDWYRAADEAAGRPYIYLSAGAKTVDFFESLRLAGEAGSHFSGVLCGRATWQDGVPAYARDGLAGFTRWLETSGLQNVRTFKDLLRAATPWAARYQPAGT